ncbi:MAG: M48 family metallopeptidase [Firmicutes bacterium]|nr:M48 family metallopeptidase [Bacillota bacterium]
MPVYGHIKANRRRTFFLFFFFALLFLGVGYVLGLYMGDPYFGIIAAAVIALLILLISYYAGGNVVTSMAGAHPVSKEEEPYLYHTVEGLSIAAGIPTPPVYIIETDIPNAFAAGRNPEKAIIAVTRGLLNKLNRLELEGVIAHELSHVRNYDILIATMAIVLAGTIVFVSEAVRRSMWFGGRRSGGKRNSGGQALIMIIVLILALLAPLFARILQFAISREREYLADAGAAELTGYPEGLASALEKISGQQIKEGPLDKQALQGLYIVNPAMSRTTASLLFATHPPIEKRIQRLREM